MAISDQPRLTSLPVAEMADTNQDDLFNDPVLYEDNDFKTSLELLNDGAGPFETIDPALTINSPHVHDDFSTDFSTRQSTTVPATQFLQQLSTQSNPNSPQTYSESAPLGFGVSSHIASLPRRSVSQPPEEVTFHRGDHWLGPRVKRHAEAQSSRSRKRTCTNPPGRQEWLSLRNQDFQLLAPTSAPYLSTHLPDHMVPEVQNGLPVAFSGQRGLHPFSPEINFGQRVDTGVGMLISSRNQDATSPRNPGAESMALPREPCSLKDKTLFLGLTVHTLLGCIDRLKAQCDSIKELAQLELYGKFPENDDQLNE